MKPINYIERNRMITLFITVYLGAILVFCFLLYFSLVVVPREQSKQTALSNDKILELIRYTNEADSLVIQIQKAPVVEAKALVPFFKWTNDLKTVYEQPFYTTIITSYTDLVNEIAQAKSGDTTLSAMKNKMISLQKENLTLIQKQDDLKLELKAAKAESIK